MSTSLTETPLTADILRGALEWEETEQGLLPHRLATRWQGQWPGGMGAVETQPSGVRVVFRTRATVVELDVVATKVVYAGGPARPDGVYDLVVDGELAGQASVRDGNVMTVDMATGKVETRYGPVATVRFDGLPDRVKEVAVWLPYNEMTRLVALRTDAPVEATVEAGRRVWLHHGSSISHGSNAATPTTTWPALAALLAGVELVNLGLGGNALLDPFAARAMRDTPADLISVKFGINIVNADLMRLRAFGPAVHGFLDTIREGHPDVPLLVVSAVLCPIHEDTPGPAEFSEYGPDGVSFRATGDPAEAVDGPTGKLTLSVIRRELARIVEQRVAAGDANLHYLDGRELYGEADAAELPLPDAIHPDAATHRRMGERFAALAFGAGGAFAGDGRA